MSLCNFFKTRKENKEEPKQLPDEVGTPDFELKDDDVVRTQCQCNIAQTDLAWELSPVFYWINVDSFGKDKVRIEEIVSICFGQWAAVSGLKYKRVNKEINANIRITMAEFDGKGKTLGVAYQPSAGLIMQRDYRRMTPPFVGDIIMDASEAWTNSMLHGVMLHEVGHALGLRHVEGSNVMNPIFLGRIVLSRSDKEEIQRRYGMPESFVV